jgi:hypothetical protein
LGESAVIDIQTEHLISLQDACRLIPGRSGKAIARATIWRWALKGHKGVRLESVVLGCRLTSHEAIKRFVAAQNHHPAAAKPVDHEREVQRVERLLASEGF